MRSFFKKNVSRVCGGVVSLMKNKKHRYITLGTLLVVFSFSVFLSQTIHHKKVEAVACVSDCTVTASAGTGGSVSPTSQIIAVDGYGSVFVTPNTGYIYSSMAGTCPGKSYSSGTISFGPVTSNCTVTVTFAAAATCSSPCGTIASGSSCTAYLSNLPTGSCSSETRTCTNGSLSGSYTYASCAPGCSSTPWGAVSSGYSNTAYSSSAPVAPTTCSSEVRSCTSGSFSGSYANTSCVQGCNAAGGFPNLANGGTVTGWLSNSAIYPTVCSSATRTCSGGTSSSFGSLDNASYSAAGGCTQYYVASFSSNGGSPSYSSSNYQAGATVSSPGSPTRTDYTFTGWSPSLPSSMPAANTTYTAQWSANTYTYSFNSNGGTPTYSSVNQAAGTTVSSPGTPTRAGYTFNGWSPSLPTTMPSGGGSSTAQWTASQCTGTPWGTVSDGFSSTAYSTSTPTYPTTCSSISQTRTCSGGSMSGTYAYSSCAQGCYDGSFGSFYNGQTTTGWWLSLPSGSGCSSATRTCTGGTTSAYGSLDNSSYNNTSCTSGCSNGTLGSFYSGQGKTAYTTATPSGTTCSSATVTCSGYSNSGSLGTLNNASYRAASCTSGCSDGTFGSLYNGQTVTGYTSSSAVYPSTCSSATRTCTGGTTGSMGSLNNTGYPYASCTQYYVASFDSNGGSPSYSSSNYTSGTSVPSPGTPTRAGYTFTGWSPTLPSAMPAANTTYTAQWSLNTQAALSITSTTGSYPGTIPLTTSGGSGAGAVTYVVDSAGTAGCSVAGSTLSYTSMGTCTVTATKAADATYTIPVSSSSTTISIKADQATLNLTPQTVNYLNSFVALSTTGGSGTGAVTYAVTTAGAGCSIAGTTLSYTSAGTCGITATKAGDSNYNQISSSSQTFTINKIAQAALSITSTTGSYPGTIPLTTSGGSGAGAVTYVVDLAGTAGCSVVGSTLSYTSSGTCNVTATKATDTNYLAASSYSLTILIKANQATLNFSGQTVNYPAAFATLSTTGGSGGGAVTYAVTSAGTANCSVSGAILSYASIGTCTVTATKAGDETYNQISSTTQTFTVTGGTQDPLYVTSTFGYYPGTTTLTTSGGSGAGAVTYVVDSAGTAGCSVAGSTLSYTSMGTCTVTATKSGGTSYNPVSSSSQIIVIYTAGTIVNGVDIAAHSYQPSGTAGNGCGSGDNLNEAFQGQSLAYDNWCSMSGGYVQKTFTAGRMISHVKATVCSDSRFLPAPHFYIQLLNASSQWITVATGAAADYVSCATVDTDITPTYGAGIKVDSYNTHGWGDIRDIRAYWDPTATITTPTATSITSTSATLGAKITSLGYPGVISDKGIVYGTSPSPTGNATSVSGLTTGVYTTNITGLAPNTTYYYRGYAVNTNGTGYSPDGTFTTPSVTPTGTITASNCEITAGNNSCNSNLVWSTINPVQTVPVRVLVVGGGGGGGPAIGGGGGGGGVVYMPSFQMKATSYTITVGSGGTSEKPGQSSVAFGAIAAGGGTSGPHDSSDGTVGGSGGGASSNNSRLNQGGASWGSSLGGNIGTIYGNKGGSMTAVRTGTPTRGAGGGGAGAAASDEDSNYVGSGHSNGGAGIASDINGTSLYYAGGGGGGAYQNSYAGNGGIGGGGGGSINGGSGSTSGGGSALNTGGAGQNGDNLAGGNGGANTGGGGGSGSYSAGSGGTGGSGVVIVNYPTGTATCTGGTITTSGGNTIHTFTSSGTLSCSAVSAASSTVTTPTSITVATSNSSAGTLYPVPYGTKDFTLSSSGTALATATATAACDVSSYWGGSSCLSGAPILTEPTATNITSTSATLNSNVISFGMLSSITSRGICYGTTPSPTTNCTAASGATKGAFGVNFSGLSAGVVYYYRGYATNSVVTGYSVDSTFSVASVPTLTTPVASSMSGIGAILGANITNIGGPGQLTERGVCYGTSPNPSSTCVSEPQYTMNPPAVKVLVVAGGGGGATTGSGGGGGGVVYNSSYGLVTGSYPVTVGAGGIGSPNIGDPNGRKGENSVFGTITAEGGGNGVSHGGCAGGNGGNGGGGPISTTCTATGGTGSQGYAGGAGYLQASWVGGSGGGGGAGQAGTAGGNSAGMGKGGDGVSNSISGAAVYYGGGGGGGEVNGSYVGAGGLGGGGNANMSAAGSNATANTGGGGGGGSYTGTYYAGGNGGSGVVIVSYPTTGSMTATGGTVTTAGGNTIHTFTSSGTFSVTAIDQTYIKTGAFTLPVTGLSQSTTYYYRGYARNITGIGYSPDGTFTMSGFPTLTTPTSAAINTTGATIGANITSLGSPAVVSERGVCYGTTPNPTTCVTESVTVSTGVFTKAITGLTPDTLYYYRGYAVHASGTAYSPDGTFSTTGDKTYNQLDYRLFYGNDGTGVTSAIAAQNTPITLSKSNDNFRLRMLMGVGGSGTLAINGQSFKLQYAVKSGSCSASTYYDIDKNTPISFYKNSTPNDKSSLTTNASDPTHSADTIVNQSYVESNIFTNSVASVPVGQDAKWDFSLYDKGVTSGVTYCIRAVYSDGRPLTTYTNFPEIMTAVYKSRGSGSSNLESVGGGGGSTGGTGTKDNTNPLAPQCSDGIDNDGVEGIDSADPNCHIGGVLGGDYVPTNNSETVSPVINSGGGGHGGGGGGDLGFFRSLRSIFRTVSSGTLLGTVVKSLTL